LMALLRVNIEIRPLFKTILCWQNFFSVLNKSIYFCFLACLLDREQFNVVVSLFFVLAKSKAYQSASCPNTLF
ncbi:hypothetical protein, partial [Listeria booriae]|uniref:hypothetical protein n=1 Tax=Listeria booriae TaxID=1552123 RepID=UPI001C8BB4B7